MQDKELSRHLLQLYEAASALSAHEFHAHALQLVRNYLHFDSGTVLTGQMNQGSEVTVRHIYVDNQPIQKLLDRKFVDVPDNALLSAYLARGKCIAEDSKDIPKSQTSLIDYCKRYEVAHTVVHISEHATLGNADVIALWRARSEDKYTNDDLEKGNLLLPHLIQARAINMRLQADRSFENGRAIVLADFNGWIQFIDDEAISIISSEWSGWTPPVLPFELLEPFKCNLKNKYIGNNLIAEVKIQGNLLNIKVSRRDDLPALTSAEQNIARLAAAGATYKEIARELCISPATVRNHLHNIYNKLGIRNKATLATKLASSLDV